MATVKQRIIFACTVICAFSIQEGYAQDTITLEPCSAEGIFEVVEKSQENILTCTISPGLTDRLYFDWRWTTNSTTKRIGRCLPLRNCDVFTEPFLFSLSVVTENTVKLTINTTNTTQSSGTEYFTNSTVHCLELFNHLESADCRTDFIYPAKDTHCTAQFTTSIRSYWPIKINCDIPKAYSALQRYSCRLLVDQEAVGSPVVMVTSPLDTHYVSGSCSMTSGLSSVDGNITVMIIPGRINVTAAVIRRPVSVRITHSCPDYVEEGSDLNCTCTADNMGSPYGFLQWQGINSAQLGRPKVTQIDNGTVFTCQLLWNATVEASVTYRLKVSWRPSRLTHNCPRYVPEGSDVNCTCFSSDAGNPPGSCQWVGRGRDDLSLQKVSLDDQGQQLECQMTWRGETVDSITYTMVVPEYLIRQARSEGKASGLSTGIGTGVGICLAIAAMAAVAVAVFLHWRRGWTLPCAGKAADAKHTSETGRRHTEGITPKPHEREPTPGNYENVNDPSPDARRNMYDGLQLPDVNMPSAYEDLQLDQRSGLSFTPKTTPKTRVPRVPATNTHGDVPTEKKKKKKKSEIQTQKEDDRPYTNMELT